MDKKTVLFTRFPYGRSEDPDVTDWLVDTTFKAKTDPRIEKVYSWRRDTTPISMARNEAVEMARGVKADILVMIDADMNPDAYLPSNTYRLDTDHNAKPFWDSSLDFLLNHDGPCVIGAPYCGPPPHENVYVFRFATYQSDHPNVDHRVVQYTREEAANRAGFEEVCCLPTGLIMFDMRVFDHPLVKPPYFDYEYTNVKQTHKSATEDCFLTRDLYIAGIPLYCNWDAWCGHWKRKCVGKPILLTRDQVAKKYQEAVLANQDRKSRLVMFAEGQPDKQESQ